MDIKKDMSRDVLSKIRDEIGMSQEVRLPRHQGSPREMSRKGLAK